MRIQLSFVFLAAVLGVALPGASFAQGGLVGPPEHASLRSLAANVVIPQRSVAAPWRSGFGGTVSIERVDAQVAIVEQVATTTLDIALRNPTDRRLEAEVILPVPEGAAVRGFTFQGSGAEPSAGCCLEEERGAFTTRSWPARAIRRCWNSSVSI